MVVLQDRLLHISICFSTFIEITHHSETINQHSIYCGVKIGRRIMP